MKRSFSILAVFVLLFIFSVGVFAQNEITIAGVLEASTRANEPQFTMLVQALEAADLLDTLDDADAAFTVFAPNDEAFQALLDELEIDLDALLADPDALSAILLYHVVDDVVLEADFEDDSELETLNGASIAVTVTSSGEIILDEFANVVVTDLEVDNGVIHVIDGVLLPPDETSTDSSSNAEACVVFTESAGTVAVRVGPGENRTSIAFLPANVEFEVLGQATAADGNVWFKLDKDQATPNRSNAEAWIAADAVESTGNCDDVVDVNAPPVIPIVNQVPPTAAPSGDGGTNTSNTNTNTNATPGMPNSGTYTIVLDQFVNASCQGFQNQVVPSDQVWTNTVYTVNISSTSSSIRFGSTNLTNANGQFRGQVSRDGYFVTIIIVPVNSGYFVGQYIYSYNIEHNGQSYACSDTTNFSATRN